MLFNSWSFALFFPLVTAVYFALPFRLRWGWLLVASCAFYMAFVPAYILILAITIAVDFSTGLMLGKVSSSGGRRAWLLASLGVNLGMLFFFKYFNFINYNLSMIFREFKFGYSMGSLEVLLPIGLSFHVFQSLAYTIEVYRGRVEPERHLGIFALYVMFYPQLVAGPIERPQQLLPQFHADHPFEFPRVVTGLKRMLWGLVKKVVVADRLALVVSPVYAHPRDYGGVPLALATLFFAFQIYCDFSGYSDIALGAAQVMGFRLMENFRHPYAAASLADFWRRWHVSLSSWFRDYMYIPLGGNRVPRLRRYGNVLTVFLASGLWHGASWTFVIWGGLHGVYLVLEDLVGAARSRLGVSKVHPRVHAMAGTFVTFGLVTYAWIFFRASSLQDAWYISTHLWFGWAALLGGPKAVGLALRGLMQRNVVLGVVGIGLVLVGDRLAFSSGRFASARWADWSWCYALILALIVLGVYDNQAFIYFQF